MIGSDPNFYVRMVSFMFWNIKGLAPVISSHKELLDLTKQIFNFDFVGFTETWLKPEEVKSDVYNNTFTGYKCISVCRGGRATNKQSRIVHRGGLSLYYKSCLKGSVHLIKHYDGDIMWLRVDGPKLGFLKDIYIALIYIPPSDSAIWKRRDYDVFDLLEKDLLYYSNKGEIILGGDFNGRSRNLPDWVPHINNTMHSPLPNLYSEYSSPRNNMDQVINNFGRSLVELCAELILLF